MALKRIERLPVLPRRRPDSHKGDFGTVLVLAGSRGMAGAAALVGASALRSGAGLARIASPREVQPIVATFDPSYMTWPLAQDDHGRLLDVENRETLAELAESATVLAVGPGLTAQGGVPELIVWLLETIARPVVLDADGLNCLAAKGCVDRLRARVHPTILTPHPGEFARLTRQDVPTIQADRTGQAERFVAGTDQLVLVLKGAKTVVADATRVYINATGNPGMATGGSGDCLTGVIAGLLAQGLEPFAAAQLGVHVHGLAGDIAREQNGEIGMIGGDIVDSLPDAFFNLGGLGESSP